MRGKLGESLASVQKFDAPVEEATTSSLEALKAFSLGEGERAQGNEFAAIPLYRHAVELDPNFAIAYARMGQAYANTGQIGPAIENTKQAFERRERTSELEKLYISTHYYDIVTGESDKAERDGGGAGRKCRAGREERRRHWQSVEAAPPGYFALRCWLWQVTR